MLAVRSRRRSASPTRSLSNPAIAQTARVDGTVILEATIDEVGAVTNVKVLRSIPLLDQAAIYAVAKWR